MNKKFIKRLSLIALGVMILGTLLSGCGNKETLESYLGNDKGYTKEINKTIEGTGLKVDIKGNNLNLIYTGEIALQGEMVEAVRKEMETFATDNSTAFRQLADKVSEDTKIKDIKVNLVCVDKDGKEFYKKTFESKSK